MLSSVSNTVHNEQAGIVMSSSRFKPPDASKAKAVCRGITTSNGRSTAVLEALDNVRSPLKTVVTSAPTFAAKVRLKASGLFVVDESVIVMSRKVEGPKVVLVTPSCLNLISVMTPLPTSEPR